MVISKFGADFIMGFEALGCVCPDGKIRAYNLKAKSGGAEWTIGFGIHSGTKPSSMYNSVTEAKNHFYSVAAGAYTERAVRALKNFDINPDSLTQYQFDALCDVAYQHGNCTALARKIKQNGGKLTEQDFIDVTPSHAGRRKKDYTLWSGQSVKIAAYTTYYNKTNSSNGYPNGPSGKSNPVAKWYSDKGSDDLTYNTPPNYGKSPLKINSNGKLSEDSNYVAGQSTSYPDNLASSKKSSIQNSNGEINGSSSTESWSTTDAANGTVLSKNNIAEETEHKELFQLIKPNFNLIDPIIT